MADRIFVNTDVLKICADHVRAMEEAVNNSCRALSGVSTERECGGKLVFRMNFMLNSGARVFGNTVEEDIYSLRTAVRKTQLDAHELTAAISKCIEIFEEVEKENIGIIGKASEYGKPEEERQSAAAQAPEPVEAPKRDYSGWGVMPNTVRDAEYAFLCWCVNQACRDGKNDKARRELFLNYLKDLPEGHPLRAISSSQVTVVSEMNGMEAITISLDAQNVIVLFAGTDSLFDGIVDANIAVLGGIRNPQADAAKALVNSLSKKGYKNIMTAGHSLGGYLAREAALYNPSVTECRTFDAPKHAIGGALHSGGKDIVNYVVDNSVVNHAGGYLEEMIIGSDYCGKVRHVDVKPNWAGPLPNHSISNIFVDGFGGMDAISSCEELSGNIR